MSFQGHSLSAELPKVSYYSFWRRYNYFRRWSKGRQQVIHDWPTWTCFSWLPRALCRNQDLNVATKMLHSKRHEEFSYCRTMTCQLEEGPIYDWEPGQVSLEKWRGEETLNKSSDPTTSSQGRKVPCMKSSLNSWSLLWSRPCRLLMDPCSGSSSPQLVSLSSASALPPPIVCTPEFSLWKQSWSCYSST